MPASWDTCARVLERILEIGLWMEGIHILCVTNWSKSLSRVVNQLTLRSCFSGPTMSLLFKACVFSYSSLPCFLKNSIWEAVFYQENLITEEFECISIIRFYSVQSHGERSRHRSQARPFAVGFGVRLACVPHRKQYGGRVSQVCIVSPIPGKTV